MKAAVLDCESVGLHGEVFAYGLYAFEWDGATAHFRTQSLCACPPGLATGSPKDHRWVYENVPRFLAEAQSTLSVRNTFWSIWQKLHREGFQLWAEWAWPVEAQFLLQCVADDPVGRIGAGPTPLHEIGSVLLAAGINPNQSFPRLDANEMPVHNPLADARQSARLLCEALRKIG